MQLLIVHIKLYCRLDQLVRLCIHSRTTKR